MDDVVVVGVGDRRSNAMTRHADRVDVRQHLHRQHHQNLETLKNLPGPLWCLHSPTKPSLVN